MATWTPKFPKEWPSHTLSIALKAMIFATLMVGADGKGCSRERGDLQLAVEGVCSDPVLGTGGGGWDDF